eukprot:288406-Pleurochrysis_carterae.AAC.1
MACCLHQRANGEAVAQRAMLALGKRREQPLALSAMRFWLGRVLAVPFRLVQARESSLRRRESARLSEAMHEEGDASGRIDHRKAQ